MQVLTRGAGCEDFDRRRIEGQGGNYIFPDQRGRGCCQADDRCLRKGGAEVGEVAVCGTEVVSPLGDTMGFVDGDAGELILGIDYLEVSAEGLGEA